MSDSRGITLDTDERGKVRCSFCGMSQHAVWCMNGPGGRTTFSLNWMADAICDGVEMFPDSAADARAAKSTCRICPAQRECATYAIEARMDHGIWGGFTPAERRDIRFDIRSGLMTLEEALA